MGPTNIKFVGSPCGQHGPYTFYKAIKFRKDSKTSILSLGEFFFVKIFKDVEVCIGELQLLWEDRYNPGSYLCMVRLYFLPEQTPDGRKGYHGEDEVLMESDKVPFLLEDLISLLASDIEWTTGSKAVCSSPSGAQNLPIVKTKAADVLKTFDLNNKGLDMRDINQERENLVEVDSETFGSQVIILNYNQYCRFRAMSMRLEGCTDWWMKNILVGAMGGRTTIGEKTKVLFCRDMFEHPVIQEHEMRQDHLAPNLRGRPKKKRMNFRKYEKDHVYSNDSDSCDSMSSSDKSSARSTPQKMKDKGQGSPVPIKIEKPKSSLRPIPVKVAGKNNIIALTKKNLKEQQEEDAVDISPFKPKGECTKDEERFYKKLGLFMKRNEIRMARLPTLGFKPVDLYQFYTLAISFGGYEQITEKRKWKHIYDKLGGSAGNTSAATCTRRHYEKFLYAYEKHALGDKKRLNSTKEKTEKSENIENNKQNKEIKPSASNANNLIKKKIKDLVGKELVKNEVSHSQEANDAIALNSSVRKSTNNMPQSNISSSQQVTSTSVSNTPQSAIVSETMVSSLTSLQNTVQAIPAHTASNLAAPNTAHQQNHVQNVVRSHVSNLSNPQTPFTTEMTPQPQQRLPQGVPANGHPTPVQRPPFMGKGTDSMKLLNPAPQSMMHPTVSAHNNPLPAKPSAVPSCQNTPILPAHTVKKVNAPPPMFPVGPVTHTLLYTASQTGKPKSAFLNPPPITRNVFATHIVYGEPFVRPSHPPDDDAQMRRCISLGKANMNLNLVTPPPAHCNPNKSVVQSNNSIPPPAHCNGGKVGQINNKKRPVHLSIQKSYPSSQMATQRSGGPSQPKRPRLVSDFLSLPKSAQNAPPKNPFVNNGVVSVIQSGPNVAHSHPAIVSQSSYPHVQQVHQLQSPTQPGSMHIIRNNIHVPGQRTSHMKGSITPVDFTSARPLSVQVPGLNVKNSGRIDSPIVISPAFTSEQPVNLSGTNGGTIGISTPTNIVLNANNLFPKLSPMAAAPPGSIIPFVAMQNNFVSMTPNNIVSVSPSNFVTVTQQNNIAIPTNSVVRPLMAIPSNIVQSNRTHTPGAVDNKVQVKQPQQQFTRVVTPKAGDPPPLSPQVVHPAFLNQINGTVQPQIMLTTPGVTSSQTNAVGVGNKGVNIAMVPYMIPMQQLYTQQQVAVNVPTSVPISK